MEGDIPQIPWATRTVVTAIKLPGKGTLLQPEHVTLNVPPDLEADIDQYGNIELIANSSLNIRDSMKVSNPLSKALRLYLEESGKSFEEGVEDWMLGIPFEDTRSVFDWTPRNISRVLGRVDDFDNRPGVGPESQYWIGDKIKLRILDFNDGKEGVAIKWLERDDLVEVWIGAVDAFILANEVDLDADGVPFYYNDVFENGFLWAVYMLGLFEKDDIPPDWAVDIIEADPDRLWPELVDVLLPQLGDPEFDPKLEMAVREWINRRRREWDRAAGQQYFWPKSEEMPFLGANPFFKASPRHKRLMRDLAEMKELVSQSTILEFEADDDEAPDDYRIIFHGPRLNHQGVVEQDHRIRIHLGLNYPGSLPSIKWENDILHPNISSGNPCLGTLAMSPSVRLVDIVEFLWDMARMAVYSEANQKTRYPLLDARLLRDQMPRMPEESSGGPDIIILGRP